jgi:hypothetical protein
MMLGMKGSLGEVGLAGIALRLSTCQSRFQTSLKCFTSQKKKFGVSEAVDMVTDALRDAGNT